MDEYDFDVPAGWGAHVPLGEPPAPIPGAPIEPWFLEAHAHLLEAPARKSTGSAATPTSRGPSTAPAVSSVVRESAFCGNKPGSRSGAVTAGAGGAKRAGSASAKKEERENDHLLAMLAEHNKKFKKTAYEPRQHNVKDVKQWEARTGKRYYELSPTSRQLANGEIAAIKDADKRG